MNNQDTTNDEQSVLSMAMNRPDYLDVAATRISAADFLDSQLGELFSLMVDRHDAGQPITPQSLLPCLLYTSPSPRDRTRSRMPSSA